MQFWYVYVLRSAKDHHFYIGSTNNLKRRLGQHQRGENISTAKRLPVELIYFEGHLSKEDALRREAYFKSTKGRTTLKQMLRKSLEEGMAVPNGRWSTSPCCGSATEQSMWENADMPFRDREEAARLLAERLAVYAGKHPLILAIPRGAVPMGKIIADALGGELDVVLVRKLGAPGNPEYAIGSVDESGHVSMNPDTSYASDDPYVREEVRRQLATMWERRKAYGRHAANPKGRVIIVVDDGIATGSTMIAALRALRAKKPAKLIAAVGVAPPESVRRLAEEADKVVCLEMPSWFSAVGQFFDDFRQVEDAEVVEILRQT